MKRPFVLTFGLILLAAAAAGLVGPLYEESATSCGSLLRPEPTAFCDADEQRRWILLLLLLAAALPSVLAGLLGSEQPDRAPQRVSSLLAAAAGLLTLPMALVIVMGLGLLNSVLYGATQVYTGLPDIFSPAALAVGALVSSRLAVRSGAAAGTAVVAAAVGLPLVLAVQAVAEAFRWTLDGIPKLLLSGSFSTNYRYDSATLVTLALAAIPMPLLLGVAARSRRQMSVGLGAALLFLSSLIGSVLFALTPAPSIRWLPLLLVPVALAVIAIRARSRPDRSAPLPQR